MQDISFTAELLTIRNWNLVLLPLEKSRALPSRGMVLIEGTINDISVTSVLEPDGRGSHILFVDVAQLRVKPGEALEVSISPSKAWPEPTMPGYLQDALDNDTEASAIWNDITPMARWDWIRWIRSTANQETLQKRVGVGLSKLKHGTRRPCCFNRSICTIPDISKNGELILPQKAAV